MVEAGIVPGRRGTPGNRDFSLEAAAETFSPLSQPVDVGSPSPTLTHACMYVCTPQRLPTSMVASWHNSIHHPGQSARTSRETVKYALK
jgi:hypothetical protein